MDPEQQRISQYMMPYGSYINHTDDLESSYDDEVNQYLNSLNIDTLKISFYYSDIYMFNMPDFSRFNKLIHLDISNTGIENVSYIPSSVEVFICSGNCLKVCPPLNDNLRVLDLSCNYITDMPVFSKNLEIVNLDNNKIKFFREFNHGLLYLSAISNCLVTSPFIPDTVRILQLSRNKIQNIPILPESLEFCKINDTDLYPKIVKFYYKDNIVYRNYPYMTYNKEPNTEQIKNYTKMISDKKHNYRSHLKRYIWHIREKIVKNRFSPEKLNFLLETFVPNDDTIEPETIEWYDNINEHWNDSHSYYTYQTVNYMRNNNQLYNNLTNFVNNNQYFEPINSNSQPYISIRSDYNNYNYNDHEEYNWYSYGSGPKKY